MTDVVASDLNFWIERYRRQMCGAATLDSRLVWARRYTSALKVRAQMRSARKPCAATACAPNGPSPIAVQPAIEPLPPHDGALATSEKVALLNDRLAGERHELEDV